MSRAAFSLLLVNSVAPAVSGFVVLGGLGDLMTLSCELYLLKGVPGEPGNHERISSDTKL